MMSLILLVHAVIAVAGTRSIWKRKKSATWRCSFCSRDFPLIPEPPVRQGCLFLI